MKARIKPRMPVKPGVTPPPAAPATRPKFAEPAQGYTAPVTMIGTTPVTLSAFLTFEPQPMAGRATAIVTVMLTRTRKALGVIRWDKIFRQYCFYPVPKGVFNGRCLTDIMAQLRAMMAQWEAERKR